MDREHRRPHADVRRAGDGVEPLLRLHRLHHARPGRVLRARRVHARDHVRARRHRLGLQPVLRAAARRRRRRARVGAGRVDRAAHAAHDVRDRHPDAAVRRSAARVQPPLPDEGLVGPDAPDAELPDRQLRPAVLPRDARSAARRARALLAHAAEQARPDAARDPRGRGEGTRPRHPRHRREADRVVADGVDHRDGRRRLGVLPDVHLPRVVGRSARDDRRGADDLPRRPRNAVGTDDRRARARADAAVHDHEARREPALSRRLRGRVHGRAAAAAAGILPSLRSAADALRERRRTHREPVVREEAHA